MCKKSLFGLHVFLCFHGSSKYQALHSEMGMIQETCHICSFSLLLYHLLQNSISKIEMWKNRIAKGEKMRSVYPGNWDSLQFCNVCVDPTIVEFKHHEQH